MSRYAETTTVPADRSRNEIEATLTRYGATEFGYAWDQNQAVIAFRIADPDTGASGRQVKFYLPLPSKDSQKFTAYYRGSVLYARTDEAAAKLWEQATRQRWRALALVIKAKLEAVAAGITTVEREFLSDIVLPSGQTVGQWAGPQIAQAYLTGKMPPLLLAGPEQKP